MATTSTTNLMSLDTQPVNSSSSASLRTSSMQRKNSQLYRDNYYPKDQSFDKVLDKYNDATSSMSKDVEELSSNSASEMKDPITAAITTSAQGKSKNTQDAPQNETQPTAKVTELEENEEPSTSKTMVSMNLFAFVAMNVESNDIVPPNMKISAVSEENNSNLMTILPQSQETGGKSQDMLNLLAGRTWQINSQNQNIGNNNIQIQQPDISGNFEQLNFVRPINSAEIQQQNQNSSLVDNFNPSIQQEMPVQQSFVNVNPSDNTETVKNLSGDLILGNEENLKAAIPELKSNVLSNELTNSVKPSEIPLINTNNNELNVNQADLSKLMQNVPLSADEPDIIPQINNKSGDLNFLQPQNQQQLNINNQRPQNQTVSTDNENSFAQLLNQTEDKNQPLLQADQSRFTNINNVNQQSQPQPQQNNIPLQSQISNNQPQQNQVVNNPDAQIDNSIEPQQPQQNQLQQNAGQLNNQPQQFNYQPRQVQNPPQIQPQPEVQPMQFNQISAQTQIKNIEIPQVQATITENQSNVANNQQLSQNNLNDMLLRVESETDSAQVINQPQQTPQQQSQSQQQNLQFANRQPMSNVFQSEESAQSQTSTENFANNLGAAVQNTNNQQTVELPTNPVEQAARAANQEENITTQIVEHARMIRNAENTEMVIHLKPEHLGELTLRVTATTNGSVNVTFHSENAQVRAMIENTIVQLKNELSNQGLKVDNVQVSAHLSDGGMMNGRGQQAWEQNQRGNNNSKIGRIGRVDGSRLTAAEESEIISSGAVQENIVTADSVDYRV